MIYPIIEHPIKGKKRIRSLSYVKLNEEKNEYSKELIIQDDQEILNFFYSDKNLQTNQKINSKIITDPIKGKKMIKSLSCVELNDEKLIEINIDQLINDKDYTILFINEKERKFQKILQDNNELIQGQKN